MASKHAFFYKFEQLCIFRFVSRRNDLCTDRAFLSNKSSSNFIKVSIPLAERNSNLEILVSLRIPASSLEPKFEINF